MVARGVGLGIEPSLHVRLHFHGRVSFPVAFTCQGESYVFLKCENIAVTMTGISSRSMNRKFTDSTAKVELQLIRAVLAGRDDLVQANWRRAHTYIRKFEAKPVTKV